jgi:hypothetical protein
VNCWKIGRKENALQQAVMVTERLCNGDVSSGGEPHAHSLDYFANEHAGNLVLVLYCILTRTTKRAKGYS